MRQLIDTGVIVFLTVMAAVLIANVAEALQNVFGPTAL